MERKQDKIARVNSLPSNDFADLVRENVLVAAPKGMF